MKKKIKTEFTLTEKELKQIIDYVRAEARLSYELKRILWLTQECNQIKNGLFTAGGLNERFRFKKGDLRRMDRQIYEMITGKDDVDTKFQVARLKEKE